MIGDSISYPRSGENWLKTVGIGGVLMFLSFLVVPIFLLQGYFVRVLRSAADDESVAPEFGEWGDLFADGLKAFVIGLVYVGIPAAVLFVGVSLLGAGAMAAGDAGAGLGVVGMLFGLVMFVVTLVAAYAVPAAIAEFAHTDEFGAAFDFRGVADVAFTGDYLVAWVLAAVVGIVGGLVANLLTIVIVGIFLAFYVQVSVYYLFGRGYAEARGLGEGRAGTAAEATV